MMGTVLNKEIMDGLEIDPVVAEATTAEHPQEIKTTPKRGRKKKETQPEDPAATELQRCDSLFRIPSIYNDTEVDQIKNFAINLKMPKKSALIAQKHIQKNKAAKKFYCTLCDYNGGNSSAIKMHYHSKKHTTKELESNAVPKPN